MEVIMFVILLACVGVGFYLHSRRIDKKKIERSKVWNSLSAAEKKRQLKEAEKNLDHMLARNEKIKY